MIVRWLGAFRHGNGSLRASLLAELRGEVGLELAAEPLIKVGRDRYRSYVPGLVGLVASRKALISVFSGDVWSERIDNGQLVKTRRPSQGHKEAWIAPQYVAIMVKSPERISTQAKKTVNWFASQFDLPILVLTRSGKIKEVVKLRI